MENILKRLIEAEKTGKSKITTRQSGDPTLSSEITVITKSM